MTGPLQHTQNVAQRQFNKINLCTIIRLVKIVHTLHSHFWPCWHSVQICRCATWRRSQQTWKKLQRAETSMKCVHNFDQPDYCTWLYSIKLILSNIVWPAEVVQSLLNSWRTSPSWWLAETAMASIVQIYLTNFPFAMKHSFFFAAQCSTFDCAHVHLI